MSSSNLIRFLTGSLLLIWFATCLEVTKPEYFNDTGDTLVLKYGQTGIGQSSRIKLTFLEVLEDSRWPKNVMCFWEGQARIQISLKKPLNEPTYLILPLYGYVFTDDSLRHTSVDTLGYSIKLLQLDPYPEDPVEPDYSEYSATIFIEKDKER